MANIIAVIWDCDKTLIDGYMQDPLFKRFNIDSHAFWEEERAVLFATADKGIRVNPDTYYLNYFIKCAHNGTIPGLNNAMLSFTVSGSAPCKGVSHSGLETSAR